MSDVRSGRTALGYVLLVLVPLLTALAWLLWSPTPVAASHATGATAVVAPAMFLDTLAAPLPRFLLQLLLVLVAAKLAGRLMRHVGQPAVVGEMLAGILLGPSLFGLLLPQAQAWLFPVDSLAALNLVSQLGVLVFMFAAGAEFDLSRLRGQRRLTLLIGHAGIALPFLFGIALAGWLYRDHAPAGIAFPAFAMFIGVALSVTAFPVLLRILAERGYQHLPIGRLAIACASLSDATAWAMLGAVVAFTASQSLVAVVICLVLGGVFALLLAGPLRRGMATIAVAPGNETAWMVGLILMILASALVTEAIGLHALFGAFLAGIAVSRNPGLRELVEQRIEPFAVVLLLPLFFASTGLRTRIDLLDGSQWLLCLGIIVIATAGKLGGTVLAARWSGIARADAWRLGALMNTRGLMELIVLGLGYELGIIGQDLYAILVVVAIATTVMTGPLLDLIDRRAARRA